MKMYQIAGFVAAAVISTCAIAATVPNPDGRVDARVTVQPGELSTATGQHTVIQRIRVVASKSCASNSGNPLGDMQCARQLSDQMIAKLPGLAELAARTTPRTRLSSK